MALSTTELLVLTIALALLMFAVGSYVLGQQTTAAQAPKFGVHLAKTQVVRYPEGLYIDIEIQSTSTATLCVSFINITDLSKGYSIVVGDRGSVDSLYETVGLPLCLSPGETVHLTVFHLVSGGFYPGTTVVMRFYYSFGNPSTTYRPDDPQSFFVFTKVLNNL